MLGSFANVPVDLRVGSFEVAGDFRSGSAGVGAHFDLSPDLSMYGAALFRRLVLNVSIPLLDASDSATENGWEVRGGLRKSIGDSFELRGGLRHTEIGSEGETAVTVGSGYRFTSSVALDIDASVYDDGYSALLALRYYFM